jgi:hypothetical protein
VLPLWKKHYDEIALDKDICPLDPDWEFYFVSAERGLLHILTARSQSGKLAGYIFNLLGSHNHYASTRFAVTEMFWLHPYFRKGWQPVRMFTENVRMLKERGAVIGIVNFKLHFMDARVGKLLARLGYEPCDITMRKRF